MTRRRKILFAILFLFDAVCISFVILVGPWPTYGSGFEGKSYYTKAIAAIDQQGKRLAINPDVGPLHVGWAKRPITPPKGTPLAGYGDRKGKPSAGVHDEIFVKALAVSDGTDTAVIVGSDMLIVPENVADRVRADVSQQTPLTANDILFNASHNHSGPGAFGPGLASKLFNGPYNPRIPAFLSEAFTDAIVEAYQTLEPARMLNGGVDTPEYIRNRARKDAPVDSELSYMLYEQDDGDRCFVVSYSAHPTVLASSNMQVTGEYPGFLMSRITEKTGAEAIYLAGAVGSMSHRAPPGDTPFARCRAMGQALADKVLADLPEDLGFRDRVDVASIGIPITTPPFQLRLNENWRVSKFLPPLLGIDNDAWMQAVHIGDVTLVGTPADYCGEISVELKSWAEDRFGDLWVLSFNGDYIGYISPDRYYLDKDEDGSLGYEGGTMSWIGPDQEAFTVALIERMIVALFP